MKIESLEKKDHKMLDLNISVSKNLDIKLTKKESKELIKRLKRGPNEKAKKFTKEALEFYEEMEKKAKAFNNK